MTSIRFSWTVPVVLLAMLLTGCDFLVDDAERLARAKKHIAEEDYRTAVIDLKNVVRSSPENAEARALLGEALLHRGDVGGAIKELTAARKNGASADVYMVPLAQAMLREGRHAELVQFNAGLLQDDKARAAVIALVGRAELATNNVDEAQAKYREALEINPQQPEALAGLARIAMSRGDFDEASAAVEKVLSARPDDHQALAIRGSLLQREGDFAGAEDSFRRAMSNASNPALTQERIIYSQGMIQAQLASGDQSGALLTASDLLKSTNEHPLALFNAARVDMAVGDNDAVIEKMQRVVSVHPQYEPARLLLAGAAMAKGDNVLAANHLQAVVNANPGHERARKLLAQVRMNQGSPDEALDVLQPLIDANNDDAQLLAMVGTANIRTGRQQEGVQFLDRGVELGNDNPAVMLQAATNFLAAGEIDRAIAVLESLPESEQVGHRDLLLVLALLRNNDKEGARARAQAVVDSRPDDPRAHQLIGGYHLAIGEFDAARKSFEKALQLDPDALNAIINLARVDVEEEKPARAEKRFERFLKRNPGNVGALTALAQLAEQRGDAEASVAYLEQAREANLDNPGPPLLLGSWYLKQGQADLAEQRVNQALRAAPNNPRAHILKGMVLLQTNRSSEALTSFQRATDIAPNMATAHFHLGRAQEISGTTDAALASYQKAVELEPKNFPARVAIIGIAFRRGDFNKALQVVEQLREDYPDRADVLTLRGDVEAGRGDLAAALAAYEQAYAKQPGRLLIGKQAEIRRQLGRNDYVALIADWVEKHPDDNEGRLMLARANITAGNHAAALEQLGIVMKQEPQASVAILQALAHNATGDLDKSAKSLEQALKLDPSSVTARGTLARLEIRRGNADRAVELAQQLREQRSDIAAMHELEGEALVAADRLDQAVDAFENALRMEATTPVVMKLFAAQQRLGQPDAHKTLEGWLSDHPTDTRVSMQLAQHYTAEDKPAEAVATYRRLLETDPDNFIALNNLAWIYFERGGEGDLQRGIDAARQAYQQRPEVAAVADTYGWLLLQGGQVEQATPILGDAADKAPENAEIQYHYAVALHRSGDTDASREVLTRLLSSGQAFDQRDEAQELLDSI